MHEDVNEAVADLESGEWLRRGRAVRVLMRHPQQAVAVLERLFALTFDANAPIASHSRLLIKSLGRDAVPFLREKTGDAFADSREMAIWLLMECGLRWATSTSLTEQVLDERYADLPDWGREPNEIIALFLDALSNESLTVRFAAASALEEFGHEIPRTVPVFVEVLRHGRSDSQNWAALHLGRIGLLAQSACEALQEACLSESPETAFAATNALRSAGCDETA